MTDAPLSITDDGLVLLNGTEWAFVVPAQQKQIAAQLAAAARVPELEQALTDAVAEAGTWKNKAAMQQAEIERLTAERDAALSSREGAKRTVNELRARLNAAPDLTELRETVDAIRYNLDMAPVPHLSVELFAAAERLLYPHESDLLAAVPSTGTDGGAA